MADCRMAFGTLAVKVSAHSDISPGTGRSGAPREAMDRL